jgi:4'-phosphopantetheinyl transferase
VPVGSSGWHIAIAADSDVGVDLEYTRVQADYADIAREFFSPVEVEQLAALPSNVYGEGFFSCWTRKEAYVKACGEGLVTALSSFSVPLTIRRALTPVEVCVAANDVVPAKRWSFFTLEPASGYIGALAIEGTGWRLTQRQWRGHPKSM